MKKILVVLLVLASFVFASSSCAGENDGHTDNDGNNETDHTHFPADAVNEKETLPTCNKTGQYESVIYCSACNEELERTTVSIPRTKHTPSDIPVYENIIEASCFNPESYDEVIYCSYPGCGHEIGRNRIEGRYKLSHNYIDDVCIECGGLRSGLFDLEGNLIASWESLLIGGLTVEEDHVKQNELGDHYQVAGSLNGVFATNNEYRTDPCKLVIDNTVKKIGSYTFAFCDNIKEVVIQDGTVEIGEYAFYNCASLESIVLPNSLACVGKRAFEKCESIDKVVISSLESWCNIEYSNHYSNPMCYGSDLYIGDELVTKVVIPNGIDRLYPVAFVGCESIEEIVFSDGFLYIGEHSLQYCTGLKKVYIGADVVSIGKLAFGGCTSLEGFVVSTDNEYFMSIDGDLYLKDGETLIQKAEGK